MPLYDFSLFVLKKRVTWTKWYHLFDIFWEKYGIKKIDLLMGKHKNGHFNFLKWVILK